MHELELVLPGMGLALPGGQPTHEALLELPSVGLYVPAEHGVKVMVALTAPTVAQKPPFGHWLQAVVCTLPRIGLGKVAQIDQRFRLHQVQVGSVQATHEKNVLAVIDDRFRQHDQQVQRLGQLTTLQLNKLITDFSVE